MEDIVTEKACRPLVSEKSQQHQTLVGGKLARIERRKKGHGPAMLRAALLSLPSLLGSGPFVDALIHLPDRQENALVVHNRGS